METTGIFPKCEAADRLFGAVYLLVGYCFIYVFTGSYDLYAALAAFTLFYVAVVLAYLKKKGIHPPKESWFWLGILLSVGLPLAFWHTLSFVQVLALMAVAAYWTLSASGRLLEKKTSQWIFFDFWNAAAAVPFGNFCQARVLFGNAPETEEKGTGGKMSGIGAVLLGLLLTAPALVIILPLLSSADAGFERMMGGVAEYIVNNLLVIFIRILLAIPVSEYLFGLIFGGIHGRKTDSFQTEKLAQMGERVRRVPDIAVCTALASICALYFMFISLQGKYLFSAFTGGLPQGFTYAEYARRGFFELCQIGAWNLLFAGCAKAFARTDSREHRGLSFLLSLLSVLTLLLLMTAVSKMGMYIDVYGLTLNRVLPLVFLIWLCLVFVLMILRQRKTFAMVRVCVMAGAVMFCLLCIFPVQGWIELYNGWARARGYIV